MYLFQEAVIMVFCKAPVPGQVKTRLIPPLTKEAAAELHSALTRKTLTTATQNELCAVQLWCSPTTGHPFFQELNQTYSVELCLQQGTDLGERMHHAFCQTLTKYRQAIIIGCDCPSLTGKDISQALTWLTEGCDCVIAPAEDGGYVLIGLTKPQEQLFKDMPWGTDRVSAMTRERLLALNLRHQELTQQWDVDTPVDLGRYLNANFA